VCWFIHRYSVFHTLMFPYRGTNTQILSFPYLDVSQLTYKLTVMYVYTALRILIRIQVHRDLDLKAHNLVYMYKKSMNYISGS